MTFTYSDALTTDRDKIRLRTKDTQANEGPRPDNRNFSDEEITFILTEESTVTASIAHTFEILTSEWTPFSMSQKDGAASFNARKLADDYRELALEWRNKPGGSADALLSGSLITLIRTDEYSD